MLIRRLRQVARVAIGVARHVAGARRLGTCALCATGVYADQHWARYRGEVYHVQPCWRSSPYVRKQMRDQRSRSARG